MSGAVVSHEWTNKPQLKSEGLFLGAIAGLVVICVFKLKPYFAEKTHVQAYTRDKQESRKDRDSVSELKEQIKEHVMGQTGIGRTLSRHRSDSGRNGTAVAGSSQRRVIERPLFDSATVTVSAVLLQGFTSSQNISEIEARVTGSNETTPLGEVMGATLTGRATANFEQKRVQFQFTELTTQDGKKYAISGVSIDPETNTLGTRAEYSSGIVSRFIGVGLGKTISTSERVVRSRILDANTQSDPIRRELDKQALDTGGQAANDLGDAATKDLRETRAELSLPAGTTLMLRMKAVPTGGVQ